MQWSHHSLPGLHNKSEVWSCFAQRQCAAGAALGVKSLWSQHLRLHVPLEGPIKLGCICTGKIQAIAETYGIFFSLTAVFVQLHAISCAILFMTTYEGVLPFPSPTTVSGPGAYR